MHRLSKTLLLLFIAISLLAAIPMQVSAGPLWLYGAFAEGFVPQPPDGFAVDKGPYFDIYYNSNNFSAMDIANIYTNMTYAYTAVVNFYGEYPYHTKVIIAASNDELRYILQNANITDSFYGRGWGDKNKGTILMVRPELVPDFKMFMADEMAHISTRSNMTNYREDLPAWFSEGMAVYVSGGLDLDKRMIVDDMYRNDGLMTIDQMDLYGQGQAGNASQMLAAKAQSGLIIEFVSKQYGNQSLLNILKDFSRDRNLDSAFMNATGKSPDGINIEWQRQISEELDVLDGKTLYQRVQGYVIDYRGNPMSYQTVNFSSMRNDSPVVYGKVFEGQTDENGYYEANVTYGLLKVHVERVGYPMFDDTLTVRKKESKLYNITLNSTSLEMMMAEKTRQEQTRSLMLIVLGAYNLAAIGVVLLVFRKSRS